MIKKIELNSGNLKKQIVAAKKYGLSLEKYQSLTQIEKTSLKDKYSRKQKIKSGMKESMVSKNIRLTNYNTYRFQTEVGDLGSITFTKGTKLSEVEKFRDNYLAKYGIKKGEQRKKITTSFISVKNEKHIKFNGITYQIYVQRMKDGKDASDSAVYTSNLKEAKKIRNQKIKDNPKSNREVKNI